MANGASPLQDFIANYMQVQQLLLSQQQFGAQQENARRTLENQETLLFSDAMKNIEHPEERQALVEFFSQRNPDLQPVFQSLADSISLGAEARRDIMLGGEGEEGQAFRYSLFGYTPESMRRSQALSRRTLDDIIAGQRTQEGLALTAGQQLGHEEFVENLRENVRQFGANFGEQVRQFDTSMSQRNREFGVSSGLQARGLDLQELGLGQDAARDRLGAYGAAGMLPIMLRNENVVKKQQLQRELLTPLTPQRRAEIQTEMQGLDEAISGLGNLFNNELQKGLGGSGSNGEPTVQQLIDGLREAQTQINTAKDTGEHQAAIARYNLIRDKLMQVMPGGELPRLQYNTRGLNRTEVMPGGGGF